MRMLISMLSVIALLVSGVASAMHVHSNTGPASAVAHGMESSSDEGRPTASHAAICHACAHHAPSTLVVSRVVAFVPMTIRPLDIDSVMALGGVWPPLAEPPR